MHTDVFINFSQYESSGSMDSDAIYERLNIFGR